MRAAERQFDAGVIQRLLDEPYRFGFFQAVRVIELWLRQHGVPHDRAVADFVRFENSTSLNFPPSEIEALSAHAAGQPGSVAEVSDALHAGKQAHIRVRPAFMGLLGGSGALPLHYSEVIAAHVHDQHDEGPRAFFDLFSSRALALFYQAWLKYRVHYKLDQEGRDGYLPMLLAFAGVAPRGQAEAGGVEIGDRSRAWFAAQIRSRVVSGSVLAGVLTEYFEVPVAIEQFAGMWDVLGDEQGSRLGANNCTLNGGATLGERIWRHDLSARVRIGPLGGDEFDRFLPSAPQAHALAEMLGLFATDVPYYEVQLLLRADDVRAASLCGSTRLGLDAFLCEREAQDRADVCYRMDPRSPHAGTPAAAEHPLP